MLVIGSRGSQLALWQANYIKGRLESLGSECRIEIITTTGDRVQNVMLKEIGTKGLFTKEIEEALLDRRIDLAVHSLKDMPGELPAGLHLSAVPEREDARDVIVGRPLGDLPAGARVGTGSLRRVAQLQALRPDLRIESIRGNVDTRLRKLDEGQYDAIVLAAAGLRRLGWQERIAEYLPPDVMCPAVGQGALAIETRIDDTPPPVLRLEHPTTRAAVTAERAALSQLGGGCQVPIGAHAHVNAATLSLRAVVVAVDGSRVIRRDAEGRASQAEAIGKQLGRELLDAGAADILRSVYGPAA